MNVFVEFFRTLGQRADHDQEEQRVLRAMRVDLTGRMLTGIVESGDYGAEIPVYDPVTDQVCYTIGRGQAPMKRLYFRIDLPTEEKRGLLLLQREGTFGIQDAFDRAFRGFFRGACPDCRLELEPLAPEEMIKHYQHPKRVKKIRFIVNRVPQNFFGLWDGGVQDVEGYFEIVFHAKVDGTLPWKTGYRQSVVDSDYAKRMLTLGGLEPDEVKVTLDVGNGERTVNVTNPRNIRASFDITNQVKKDPVTGHLTYETLQSAADEIAERIGKRLRMVVTDVQQDQPEDDPE